MSLVVAVKDKGRVVFGSDRQISTGGNKSHTETKIWEVRDLPGAIMGGVGSARASQIIQYNKVIDLNDIKLLDEGVYDISTEFVINSLVPVIVTQLQNGGITCSPTRTDKEDSTLFTTIPNVFLFAYLDRAWMIWQDLSVKELIDDYLTIGSGADVATGVLFATPDKNPFERIVTCIEAAAENTLFVDDGVDLLATDYYPEDKNQIIKALDLEEYAAKMQADQEELIEAEKEKAEQKKKAAADGKSKHAIIKSESASKPAKTNQSNSKKKTN